MAIGPVDNSIGRPADANQPNCARTESARVFPPCVIRRCCVFAIVREANRRFPKGLLCESFHFSPQSYT